MPSDFKTRLYVSVDELTVDENGNVSIVATHPLIPLKSITESFSINNTKIHSTHKPNAGTVRGNTDLSFSFNVSSVYDSVAGVNPAKELTRIGLLGIPFNVVTTEVKTQASNNKQNFAWESIVMLDCVLDSGQPLNYTSGGEPVSAFAGKGSAIQLDGLTYDGITES